MQAALVEVTQRTGIRACGPNCEGYFNALGKVATTFSPTVEVKEDEASTWCPNAVSVSSRNRAASALRCSIAARQRGSASPT